MSLEWSELDRRARGGDVPGLTSLLLEATEQERRALADEVEAQVKALTPESFRRPTTDPTGSFGLIVLATMPSAPRTARLLLRRDMRNKWDRIPIPHVLTIVRARELPWLGDLATRLAAKLTTDDAWTGGWKLIATLLAESGSAPPASEPVVHCWLDEMLRGPWERPPVAPVDMFRASPFLDLLFPALFEIDGLGAELKQTWIDEPVFPGATAQLVAEGRLDRKQILSATVDRLVRGDRPAFLRPFVLLHEALAPTVDELAGHALDYARLLPDAPSTVAALAQRALRATDEAGLLDLDTVLEVSRPTLLRKEKTLVKAQLSWLDKVARRDTSRADEVVETIAVAFGHPALDVQERALTLTGRHLELLPDGPGRLAEFAGDLGGDLAARAAELFGSEKPAPVVVELPPPAPVAEMPPPITSAAELATEVAAVLHEETSVRWERILAGLVSLQAAGETASLAATLGPLLERHADHFAENHWQPRPRLSFLAAAIHRLVDPAYGGRADRGRWQRLVTTVRAAWTVGEPVLAGPPDRLLSLRVIELYTRVLSSPVPELFSTPTQANGSLDAAVLAGRIRRAESEGREPWPLDLEQALLRLPRDSDPAVAAGLTSPAGRKLAGWLAAGGLPDPVSTRIEQAAGSTFDWHVGPPPAPARLVVSLTPARKPLLRVEDQIVDLQRRPTRGFGGDEILNGGILTAALPHHREVLAAWALPGLAALADEDHRGFGALLPLLAECDGPIGPAMTLALAYTLAARHEPDRVAAVDAFLALAAGPAPFAAAVGRDLGELGAMGVVKLNRVAPALADAHRAGASAAAWALLAQALPLLLPASPRGLPDLLELATQVATTVGARDEIPHLAEAASQKGGSRLLKEVKRLHSTLTG
jgi:hypothetical protein